MPPTVEAQVAGAGGDLSSANSENHGMPHNVEPTGAALFILITTMSAPNLA